jgi:hypothetical protein
VFFLHARGCHDLEALIREYSRRPKVRLSELEPEWFRVENPVRFAKVETIAEADGVAFLCPKCFTANAGRVGTHMVLCWRPHVPQEIRPNPGRWEFEGTSFDDLTLVAGSSSVHIAPGQPGSCEAHFWVRDGAIVMT